MAAAVTDQGAPPADRRRMAVPVLLVVGTTLSVGAAVWATSYPGTTWRYYGLAFVLSVATAGLWLVSLVVRLGNRRRPSALHVAGFAYLPDGPDHFEVELAEVQVLEPIGDGWYRFVASW